MAAFTTEQTNAPSAEGTPVCRGTASDPTACRGTRRDATGALRLVAIVKIPVASSTFVAGEVTLFEIAALLPQYGDVAKAIEMAKRYVTQAIAHADQLQVGRSEEGHGPVHHFYEVWK